MCSDRFGQFLRKTTIFRSFYFCRDRDEESSFPPSGISPDPSPACKAPAPVKRLSLTTWSILALTAGLALVSWAMRRVRRHSHVSGSGLSHRQHVGFGAATHRHPTRNHTSSRHHQRRRREISWQARHAHFSAVSGYAARRWRVCNTTDSSISFTSLSRSHYRCDNERRGCVRKRKWRPRSRSQQRTCFNSRLAQPATANEPRRSSSARETFFRSYSSPASSHWQLRVFRQSVNSY